MHRTYQVLECAQAYLVNLDNDYELDDADTVTITITDPAGTVVVNGVAMVNESTGIYTYNYDIPSDAVLGVYTVVAVITTTGHVNKEYSSFRVR